MTSGQAETGVLDLFDADGRRLRGWMLNNELETAIELKGLAGGVYKLRQTRADGRILVGMVVIN